jgi:peptidoglycan hydrolase CwlO-like protein
MRKLNYSLILVLVVGLSLTILSIVSAQQNTGQPGANQQNRQNRQNQQQRTQMDPEAMIQQRLGRILEQLKLSDEETTVLKPKIEGLMRIRMTQSQNTRELINSLREAINAKNTEQIKAKLTEIKSKREENRKKIEALEEELIGGKEQIGLLTLGQEALLTVSGIVNSDGAGGFFGGGPGGPGGTGAPGNQGGNPPQPPQPPQE